MLASCDDHATRAAGGGQSPPPLTLSRRRREDAWTGRFRPRGGEMRIVPLVLIVMTGVAAVSSEDKKPAGPLPDAAQLTTMAARFAPVSIAADVSKLPPAERQALARLVEAARIMDPLFLRQSWAGNEAVLLQLLGD